MAKYIWSITGIAALCYAVTILFQYGYLAYFNIPATFIKGSIADNVVFAHDLLKLGLGILAVLRWWWIILLSVLVLLVLSFLHQYKTMAALALIFLVYGFYGFGNFSARNQTVFFAPKAECSAIGPEKDYVAVSIADDKAILVSIDDNRHLKAGFVVKDVSEIGCGLELREIGTITK